jgi:hypothetical protein
VNTVCIRNDRIDVELLKLQEGRIP